GRGARTAGAVARLWRGARAARDRRGQLSARREGVLPYAAEASALVAPVATFSRENSKTSWSTKTTRSAGDMRSRTRSGAVELSGGVAAGLALPETARQQPVR